MVGFPLCFSLCLCDCARSLPKTAPDLKPFFARCGEKTLAFGQKTRENARPMDSPALPFRTIGVLGAGLIGYLAQAAFGFSMVTVAPFLSLLQAVST